MLLLFHSVLKITFGIKLQSVVAHMLSHMLYSIHKKRLGFNAIALILVPRHLACAFTRRAISQWNINVSQWNWANVTWHQSRKGTHSYHTLSLSQPNIPNISKDHACFTLMKYKIEYKPDSTHANYRICNKLNWRELIPL